MNKDKEWLKDEINKITSRIYGADFSTIKETENLIDQLEPEITQDQVDKYLHERNLVAVDATMFHQTGMQNKVIVKKPVIPQFVADFIEAQYDPVYEMCVNYEMWGVNGDDGTTDFTGEIAEWFDDSLNVENYYRACIDGYEVEKEKKYRVRAGNRYVRFNLDGSIIGVKKDNSIVCLERLSKLPFDYKKAVESGIITLEEVTE